jgi:hypothetical protein
LQSGGGSGSCSVGTALYLAAAGNLPRWLAQFYALGVDGVFTDNPDTGVAVREQVS